MDKNKQLMRSNDKAAAQRKLWGTTALTGLFLLVCLYLFTVLLAQPRTPVAYIAMSFFIFASAMSATSIVFIIRQKQELALRIVFYTLSLSGVVIALLVQGRVLRSSLSILVISAIAIWWLLPRQSWRRYAAVAAASAILAWVIEWINPSWRIQLGGVPSVGPAATIVFAVILAVVGLIQGFRGNLRNKLVVAFLVVTLIPLGIVFYLNNRTTSQNLTDGSNTALNGVAAQTAASLDTFLSDRLNDVRTEAQRHILQEYLLLPASARAGSESEGVLNADLFAMARRDQTFITSVGLLDKNGISVADTEPSEVGVDKSKRNYFIGARDSQLPFATPVEVSATTGALSMYFSSPVRDANGNFIGVLRIRYDGTVIQSIVKNSAEQSNLKVLSVVVFDENHIRLAHSVAPELILKSIVPLPAEKVAQLQAEGRLRSGVPAAELSTNVPSMEDSLNNLDQKPFFVAEFHDEGEGNEEGTAVRLKTQPWLIAAGQDQDVFLAPLAEQTRTNIILALIFAGAVGLVAFVIAQTISNPVQRLTNVAQQIASGDIAVQAKVESNDEIGQLAGTFNQMTAQLREFIGTLEQRVADRTKALATSSEVSRRLSTILNQQELVTEVVNQVNNAFGYYHTQIYFFDEANENLVMAGGTGEAGELMLAQFHKVPQGRGLVGRSAESNKAVLVSDTTNNPDWLPNPLLPQTKSEVAIPIAIGEQVLGVLDVQHNVVEGLQQENVDSLQSIANQIAVAMQNIRQYQNSQKVANDLGVVASVGIATSTITDINQLLQEVVDLSKKSFNLYHAHLYMLNEAGDTLQLASGAGEVGRKMVAEGRSIPLNSEQSLVARAARGGQGVVVNDVTVDPNFLPNPLLPETRSELAVPMLVSGRVTGVLDVQSELVNRYTDVDVNIMTTLASQIAVAVQNARNFAASKRQAERETAVNVIGQKIQNTTSIEAALQMAARELGHALGAKSTLVSLDQTALADKSASN